MKKRFKWLGLVALLVALIAACGGNPGGSGPPGQQKPGAFTLSGTVSCVAGELQVVLNWTAASGADSYTVLRDDVILEQGLAVHTFTDDGPLAVDMEPTYLVRASNSQGTTDSGTWLAQLMDCDEPMPETGLATAVSTGDNHVLVRTEDGQVISWGMNLRGSLGRPGHSVTGLPEVVPGLQDIQAVAAGTDWSLALDTAGRVYSWGSNGFGQLGTGDTDNRHEPRQVTGLDGTVLAIATGRSHSLALTTDGRVYAWGANSYGQLGQGTATNGPNAQPVLVGGLGAVTQLVSGADHVLALLEDRTVVGWGKNINGQLGLGMTTFDADVPQPVPDLDDVVQLAAGRDHSLALTAGFELHGWGQGSSGQLGIGDTGIVGHRTSPNLVTGLPDIALVSAGGDHTFARDTLGNWWAWGANHYGQLGDGGLLSVHVPVQLSADYAFVSITSGLMSATGLNADGSLHAWGSGRQGLLGRHMDQAETEPQQVSGLSDVVHASGSFTHSLAVTGDGRVWAWGLNSNGQLGTGDFVPRFTPTAIDGIDNARAVAAGGEHSLVLLDDGTVQAFGRNHEGQLGVGDELDRNEPTAVTGISDVQAITAGTAHSLAITGTDVIWAWGDNTGYRLGNPVVSSSDEPFEVEAYPGVLGIVTSDGHTVAYTSDGARAWGRGTSGELGIGATGSDGNSTSPVDVQVLTAPTAVALGSSSSIAIQGGAIWVWGNNFNGQLGIGSMEGEQAVPVEQHGSPITDATRIAAGSRHVLALQADGHLYAWGSNSSGEIGNGGSPTVTTPEQVLTGVRDVFSGINHSFAVLEDGSLLAWGTNEYGQLGLGTALLVLEPQPVDY